MKRFNLIVEGYDLGAFTISRGEFLSYERKIYELLHRGIYASKIVNTEGLSLIGALDFEKKSGRDFSILSKVNTNVTLMKWIVRTFKLHNFKEIIDFISKNANDLFAESGKYFREVIQLLTNTENVGDKNEELAIDYIKSTIRHKLGIDITPTKTPPGSYDDMILGIDIKFNINGKEFTCQVKPLVEYKLIGDNYIITSSGNNKSYRTHYLAFANPKTDDVILFQNREVSISGHTITIPKKFFS